ncbi:hypothetical protein NE237_002872 [Protea cynaroides]|uniref:Uncharacterized protein n=1 Tax=Protea cynaroides TaxID=273540 RepID=A0A9Q0KFS9_9MAGN|nr:hypothetical protein NE237_002872 [Protea cynaroides]
MTITNFVAGKRLLIWSGSKMENSVLEQSFCETDDEDVEKAYEKGGDGGNDSDYSDVSSVGSRLQNQPSSYNTSWPQSYRQSIDLYSSIPSPNIGFLGTPTLSRLSSSFLLSSLTRRHTPEVLSSVVKPLLDEKQQEQQQHQRRSSHALLPPIPSKRASSKIVPSGHKSSQVSLEQPFPRQCSYGQAVLNGKL